MFRVKFRTTEVPTTAYSFRFSRFVGVLPNCTLTHRKHTYKGIFLITIQFRTIWIPTKPYYEKRPFFVCPTLRGLPKFHPKTTITFGLVIIFQVFKKKSNSFKVWRTRVLHRIRYLRQRTSFRKYYTTGQISAWPIQPSSTCSSVRVTCLAPFQNSVTRHYRD